MTLQRIIVALAAAVFCLVMPALAAVTPNSFVTPQTPTTSMISFIQGTDAAGSAKTLYTSGTNGSRCYSIIVMNTDGSATHAVQMRLANGSGGQGAVTLNTVSSAGFSNNNPPQDLMKAFGGTLPKDQYGNDYLQLKSGDFLSLSYATNLTTSTGIWLHATCADF